MIRLLLDNLELNTQLDAKVSTSGDSMTGFLTLSANPTASGHAANKAYVDSSSGGSLTSYSGYAEERFIDTSEVAVISGNAVTAANAFTTSSVATYSGYAEERFIDTSEISTISGNAVTAANAFTTSSVATYSGYAEERFIDTSEVAVISGNAVTAANAFTTSSVATYSGYAEGRFIDTSEISTISGNAVTNANSFTTSSILAYSGSAGSITAYSGFVDNNFVSLAGTQNITGAKTFTNTLTFSGSVLPATSGTLSIGSASFPVQTVTVNNLTSSPGQALNLQTGSAGTLWSVSTDSIGAKSSISSSNSVGVIGLSTVDGSDNGRLEIRGYGTDGSVSASTRGGAIYLNGNENTGSVSIIAGNMSGAGTGISFSTGGALRITTNSNGHFFPGGDNAQLCGAAGSRWSQIWAANGTIQTSDGREKNTITNSTLGLDFINALRPVSYKWTVGHNVVTGNGADENGNILPPTITPVSGTRTHWGLIAQEVKAALPSGVDFGGWILTDIEDENSQQGLRYDQFICPLIKAIQELTARVESLENP